MKLPRETIDWLLDTWPVGRLATLSPQGRPHQVPIVFAKVGRLIWTAIDAKPKAPREMARVRHVREHPAVSLLLDHYDDDWQRLWWLRIDATARVVEPQEQEADAALAAVVAALEAKYPQYQGVPVLRQPRRLLALEPTGFSSWCAGREALPVR